jgi:Ser/Thr protein kinase RdoA (MazF antagonist)
MHEESMRSRDDSSLAAAELAMLWQLARQLQACVTLAEAEAIAAGAMAETRGRSPTLEQAVTETVAPALESLRERDPAWGLRDLGEITGLAAEAGFGAPEVIEMPANNLTVAFGKA